MGVDPNSLRSAAATGTVLLRWDGARSPLVWTVPAPEMDAGRARLELVRRYLHVFGPATAVSFAGWAGISTAEAGRAFAALASAMIPVRTPAGEVWILAEDEAKFRVKSNAATATRLLPSGDAYYLVWGADRELLVADAKRRGALWTSRVWPGALLIQGEIVGIWRRAAGDVSIETWRRLSSAEREDVEAEALSLPLPGVDEEIVVRFQS